MSTARSRPWHFCFASSLSQISSGAARLFYSPASHLKSCLIGGTLLRAILIAGFLAVPGARLASAQVIVFTASPSNPAPGNNGVQGVTGAGSSGFLNTAANQAVGLQANGLLTMNAVDVAGGDFNGDGIQDIYTISADNLTGTGTANTVTLTILPGVGDGTFGMPVNFAFTGQSVQPVGFGVLDIDGDGLSDVAIVMTGTDASGTAFNELVVMYGKDLGNAQPGAMVPSVNLPLSPFLTPVAVTMGRLQADALGDIAVAGAPGVVQVFLHDPATGLFTTPGAKTKTFFPPIVLSSVAQLGYLTPRAIAIGKSNFTSPVVTNPPGGNLDVFIAGQDIFNSSTSVIAILANADIVMPSSFMSNTTLPAGIAASGVVAGDINGDGIPDLVFVDHANGSAGLYLGQNFFGFAGGYSNAVLDSYGAGTDFPTSLSIMNFSGTGQHDLATVNQGSTPGNGKIRVLASNPAGTSFTLAATFTNPSLSMNCPTSIATGRFDVRSTHDDILWSDPPPCSPDGDISLDSSLGWILQAVFAPTAPTSVSIPVALGPPVVGQPVSFTFHVTGVPAGTQVILSAVDVNRMPDGFAEGTTNAQGDATLTITFSRSQKHHITAICDETFNFRGSVSPALTLDVSVGAPQPSISGFTPMSGPVGSSVTIMGNFFSGTTQVAFNGVPTAFTVDPTGSVITATVPAGGTGQITVATPSGTVKSTKSFSVQPVITSFTPTSGMPGTQVTINGSGFTGVTEVKFNGVSVLPSKISFVNDGRIVVVVPDGATTGKISLTTAGATATSSTNFTVPSKPIINDFSPPSGPVSTSVTINGSGFTGATGVAFNGIPATAFTVVSDSQIKATVPAAASTSLITVGAPGGIAVSMTSFTVLPPATTKLMVTGFPSPITAGAPGPLTVTAKDALGNTVPTFTHTVHFTSSDLRAMLPPDYTFVSSDNGIHTFTVALDTAGSQSITATDTVNSIITGTQSGIQVNPAATSKLLVGGFPSPTTVGAQHIFTVTPQDAFGNFTPSYGGTLHLSSTDSQATLPPDSQWTAIQQYIATLRSSGTRSITATDTVNSSITGTQNGIVVSKADTTITISGPATLVVGQEATYTVMVRPVSPAAGIPTRNVFVFLNGSLVPIILPLDASGNATFPLGQGFVGTISLDAAYDGDPSFNRSRTLSPFTVTVGKAFTTTTVISNFNPSVFSQEVTFTGLVNAVAPGRGTPGGMVTFLDGTTVLGTAAPGAHFISHDLPVGPHNITGVYGGDGNFMTSTSTSYVQVVNKDSTATVLTSSSNAAVPGQSVTLTATVNAAPPGAGIATGTVQLGIDGAKFGFPSNLVNGIATFPISTLPLGPHVVIAQYSGDSNFLAGAAALDLLIEEPVLNAQLGSHGMSSPGVECVNLTFTNVSHVPAFNVSAVFATKAIGGTATLSPSVPQPFILDTLKPGEQKNAQFLIDLTGPVTRVSLSVNSKYNDEQRRAITSLIIFAFHL